MKLIDSDKLKERVTRLIASARKNDWPIAEDYLRRVIDIIDSLQQEQPETDMKSPFTGGKVTILSREEEVTFRGEKVKILRKYYCCEDTGREFTDSKLDDDMMWSAFRAYCEKKGMTSFTDIMLKQEQPEVDLDKETIIDYVHNHYHYDKDFDGYGHSNLRPVFTREDLTELGRHFYELGLNARK